MSCLLCQQCFDIGFGYTKNFPPTLAQVYISCCSLNRVDNSQNLMYNCADLHMVRLFACVSYKVLRADWLSDKVNHVFWNGLTPYYMVGR